MRVTLTAEDLVAFENEIADLFLQKKIRAPIHLSGGNEADLIEIFTRHVGPQDWICTTWRSHYACLLKGVPPAKVKDAILAGRSIALCFPEYRVISSAIVGGMAPIAVGLAMGIKRKREAHLRRVVCFVGDMAAECGIVHECMKYSRNNSLPLLWVIEDNGLSTATETSVAWSATSDFRSVDVPFNANVIRYKYVNRWPHCGVGQYVSF